MKHAIALRFLGTGEFNIKGQELRGTGSIYVVFGRYSGPLSQQLSEYEVIIRRVFRLEAESEYLMSQPTQTTKEFRQHQRPQTLQTTDRVSMSDSL